jgi:hypothetical protein
MVSLFLLLIFIFICRKSSTRFLLF